MPQYDRHGLRFEYPDNWEVLEENSDGTLSVTVESPDDVGFWMVSVMFERPPAEEVIESALASFREEYEHVDIYESDDSICLLPTLAKNLDIVCLDLVGRVVLRACETDDASIFVLGQMMEADASTIGPVMNAMSASLMWEPVDGAFDPFSLMNPDDQDEAAE